MIIQSKFLNSSACVTSKTPFLLTLLHFLFQKSISAYHTSKQI